MTYVMDDYEGRRITYLFLNRSLETKQKIAEKLGLIEPGDELIEWDNELTREYVLINRAFQRGLLGRVEEELLS